MTPHILRKLFEINREMLVNQNAHPVVLITDKLTQFAVDALGDSVEARWADGPNRAELLAVAGDANALLVRSVITVDQEALGAVLNLKIVGCAGVGLDDVDIDTATKRDIMVIDALTSNIHSTCEHAIALLLTVVRQSPAMDASLCEGEQKRSSSKGVEILDKTIGIVSLGHIGQLFVQRLAASETNITAHGPYTNPVRTAQLGIELVELEELMARANFVAIHLLKARETAGMFDAGPLGKTKRGQIIISAVRGGPVDEQAPADAAKTGDIHGAGFDVYAVKPCTDSPLPGLPETVCAPHLGASTIEAQGHVGTDVVKSVLLTLAGEFVSDIVNVPGSAVGEEVALWLEPARELGLVASGLLGGVPVAVKVAARGELHTEGVNVPGMAVIRGLLFLMVEELVTFVNAPRIAEGRGVTFTVETESESISHRSILEVKIIDADGSTATVVGAFAGLNCVERVVRINGRGTDMRTQDRNLFLLYKDIPGTLGRVATTLGGSGTNIEAAALSPQGADQIIILVLRVSKEVPEELVEKTTEEISATHALQLKLGQS